MDEAPPRVELYVRSLAPTDVRNQQERVVGTLQTLDAENRIKGMEVRLCGDCVCPSLHTAETDIGDRLLRRYDAFKHWAMANDRELIGFETRDNKSLLTGTTVTGIVFPRLTLAEFRDGDLTFVAPSKNGTEQTNVVDRLETY